MSQSVLFNSGIALSGRIATLALGILATALITRILGAAQFGQYSFVATIATFLQLTADFGLYLTASRELGYGDGHDIQFGHILSLRGIFLLIIYSLGALVFFLLPTLHPLALLFVILAVGFAVQSMSQLFMSIFQAYGVVWRATISDITGRMVQVALLWAFYAHTMVVSQRILEVAAAFSGGLFIAWCIHIVLIPRKKLLVPAISFSIWRKIIKISMPIGALLVLNTIY
ncbi:MAG TPA: oligosaccharide flippase family protein, partial [Candidatus Andersenbacteria bacterium]|nr:oligosaccharide flippase family protein [Candidatus Andersenbacteria bacterium]